MICCHVVVVVVVVVVKCQDLGSRKAKSSRFLCVDEEQKHRVKTYVALIKKSWQGKKN